MHTEFYYNFLNGRDDIEDKHWLLPILSFNAIDYKTLTASLKQTINILTRRITQRRANVSETNYSKHNSASPTHHNTVVPTTQYFLTFPQLNGTRSCTIFSYPQQQLAALLAVTGSFSETTDRCNILLSSRSTTEFNDVAGSDCRRIT
jgi:hypothetical protein